MKTKINRFAKGDFQVSKPDIIFPETRLILRVGEGELYKGSFSLQNQADGKIRGLVYPSSFRVQCEEQGFEGNPVNVYFTYDGHGLLPGHVEHGTFTIVCNGGEYQVAFTAIIEKPFVMTAYGKVQSLEDFKKLAFKDFAEAEKLFRSREFYEILKYEEKRIRALYENMRKWELDQQALEEFLVGCKHKEKIFLMMQEESRAFTSKDEDRKEILTISKNTWGFMAIDVHTVGDFLTVEHSRITTDEFIGSSYRVEYIIKHEKLHAGNNYGQIILESPYETLTYEVVVSTSSVADEDYRLIDIQLASLLKSYLAYEAGKYDLNSWVDSALRQIEAIREKDKGNERFLLIQAHINLLGQRQEEAKWILESYNYNRFAIGKNVELSSYYLYLTTMLSNDSVGQRKVAEELSRTYLKNPDNGLILCMLVNVDQEFKLFHERLRMLEQQYYRGTHNVALYMEAYKCYREKSNTLKRLGEFEVHVLAFALKYKMLTKELALYTANLASQQKQFDKHLYDVLAGAYKMFEEPMILTAICTLLIKGNCSEQEYFKWYEKAVDSELKIAQLYEYYMLTINEERFQKPLPRSVYLYFMHGNSLDYQKCALLYSNLIDNEDETSEIYAHYREDMENFAWNQLEKRRINAQLRVIYKRFITEDVMNPKRIEALYDICHAYEIKTKVPNMKFLQVIGEDGTITQKVPYTEQGAQVFLYAKTDRLVWENKDGRHFMDSIPYESKRLFYELRYMDMCKRFLNSLQSGANANEKKEFTLELVQEENYENFKEEDLLTLCSKTIREINYNSNDFLTYLCYELFKADQYDKITLTYLTNFFSGTTTQMKRLWREAKEYEIHTHQLSERILTQMLFSEELVGEEGIFEDYYSEGAYFRLQQAYLNFVAREYVVRNRKIHKGIIDIVCNEYKKGEFIQDICQIAVLKYYSEREYSGNLKTVLKEFLQDLCTRQIYFPFYLKYNEEWLLEFQLWDKTLIEYKGQKDSRVVLYYQITNGEEDGEYQSVSLLPMYDTIYVKKFILYAREKLKYYFQETIDGNVYTSEVHTCVKKHVKGEKGRYGKLNRMILSKEEARDRRMDIYAKEDAIAAEMFKLYE
ncbi:MAG: DUF5717 family protein [Hespellia sp.]|nr:DUF5717 family protein [Hespellia sp.]